MLPAFFAAIGTDRHLTVQEVARTAGPHEPRARVQEPRAWERRAHEPLAHEPLAHEPLGHEPLAAAWQLYEQQFEGFCETRLDPMCHRLTHPARQLGTLALDSDDAVLVVGTGPSSVRALPELARVRDRVRVFTSPRGAALLAGHGIVPDLVLVEHRTAIDAHHATQHEQDGLADAIAAAPLVAAEWRTPSALIARVPPARLFVPEPLPTWSLWPATLVAMALDGGARRIALLGIDLGTAARPSPEFEPLSRLLGLLAQLTPRSDGTATIDCGVGGAIKEGWRQEDIEAAITSSDRALDPLEIRTRPAPAPEERRAAARDAIGRLSPIIRRAHQILALAIAARGGAPDVDALHAAAADLLAWRDDLAVRIDVQEALGCTFLPRLWRLGIEPSLGSALWRPVLLATHELVGQADRLAAAADRCAA